MSDQVSRETLSVLRQLLSGSTSRSLNSIELEELERLCVTLERGIADRLITTRALMDFAVLIRNSGLLQNGQAGDLESLLQHVESVEVLLG